MRKLAITFCTLAAVSLLLLAAVSHQRRMEHTFGSVASGWFLTVSVQEGLLDTSFGWLITFEEGSDVLPSASAAQLSPADGIWACDFRIDGNRAILVPRIQFLGMSLKGYRSQGRVRFKGPQTSQTFTGTVDWREVGIPLWMFIVVLASYPVILLVRGLIRKRHRRRKGLCLTCAYDLRDNTTGVCPECGSTIGSHTEHTID